MSVPPANPKLYHITHAANLAGIVAAQKLLSDAEVQAYGPARQIGVSEIKRRRRQDIVVTPHPGTKVGDYVPFYFCPRSVMLYVLHMGNLPDLAYREGQDPIVHLEADLRRVIRWADENNRRWAFSLSNAGSYYVQFRATAESLSELDWEAIGATDFRRPEIKESKQAEFLLFGSFPFGLVERIGVHSAVVRTRAARDVESGRHRPVVEVIPSWYY